MFMTIDKTTYDSKNIDEFIYSELLKIKGQLKAIEHINSSLMHIILENAPDLIDSLKMKIKMD